jgi:hypothetical protein
VRKMDRFSNKSEGKGEEACNNHKIMICYLVIVPIHRTVRIDITSPHGVCQKFELQKPVLIY